MVDFNKILNGLSSNSTAKGFLGGLAGGAVSGALTSKSGRKNAAKLVKYGGLAAVGALAWKAYKDYSTKQSSSELQVPPSHTDKPTTNSANQWQALQSHDFQNLNDDKPQDQSLFILKTMVAAAMSDGHLSPSEYQNISNKADELGLESEDKQIVFNEISNPMDLTAIIEQAQSPQLAMEVYTASLLAIDESQVKGQSYLQALANGLQLPPPLVDAVHQQISQTQ